MSKTLDYGSNPKSYEDPLVEIKRVALLLFNDMKSTNAENITFNMISTALLQIVGCASQPTKDELQRGCKVIRNKIVEVKHDGK